MIPVLFCIAVFCWFALGTYYVRLNGMAITDVFTKGIMNKLPQGQKVVLQMCFFVVQLIFLLCVGSIAW